MPDISHAGSIMTMQTSVTIPAPVILNYSAKDTDPFDVPNITIAESEMGTNGHVISWSTAVMTEFTISVIPKSPSHVALATVLDANVIAPGKTPNNDVITFSRVMPDGTTMILKDCKMTGGTPYMSLASSGKIKTPTYTFRCPPQVEVIIPQL